MTDQQHSITPPPELIEKWHSNSPLDRSLTVATQAARWGADRELDACCEWASQFNYDDYRYQDELRALRRPKPPSLKLRIAQAIVKGDKPVALSLLDEAIPDD